MTTTFNCPSCKTKNERSGPEIGCSACGFGRPPHQHEEQPTPPGPRREEAVPPPPGYQGDYLTETT